MAKYEGQDHYLILKRAFSGTGWASPTKANWKRPKLFVAWRSYELSQKPIAGTSILPTCKPFTGIFFSAMCTIGPVKPNHRSFQGKFLFRQPRAHCRSGQSDFRKTGERAISERIDTAAFSERAAYYLGEINALHPFREGNGRAQREFVNHLARANGYGIDWTSMSPEAMTQASIEAFHRGDTAKFRCFHSREYPAVVNVRLIILSHLLPLLALLPDQ